MAAGYARDNIRVHAVVPGTVDTPMNQYLLADDQQREHYIAAIPMKRLGVRLMLRGIRILHGALLL
jgi:glucose 1-dehydrogenase